MMELEGTYVLGDGSILVCFEICRNRDADDETWRYCALHCVRITSERIEWYREEHDDREPMTVRGEMLCELLGKGSAPLYLLYDDLVGALGEAVFEYNPFLDDLIDNVDSLLSALRRLGSKGWYVPHHLALFLETVLG